MGNPQPFRFAVQSFNAESGRAWREKAQRAEDLGYSAIHLADHFLGPGPALEQTRHPMQGLAAVPAMTAAACATEHLRIGCRVFCIDYRHPVMLAKEAATMDLLSDGRLELGLGAGWLQAEYEAAAIPFDPPGVRIRRLQEYTTLLRRLFSGEQVAFDGEFAQAHGFAGAPVPVQQPHPPLMIGGGGRRVLELAGREADVVSLNFNNRAGVIGPDGIATSTAEATAQKTAWVAKGAAGRTRPPELEIGAYFTIVTDDARGAAAQLGSRLGLEPDEALAHPHALIGSPDSICETLEARRERYGINYITVGEDAFEAFAPIARRLHGR